MSAQWYLDIALRPIGALVLFGAATLLGRLVTRNMKPGRFREFLTKERPHGSWTVILWLTVPVLILGALILFAPNKP